MLTSGTFASMTGCILDEALYEVTESISALSSFLSLSYPPPTFGPLQLATTRSARSILLIPRPFVSTFIELDPLEPHVQKNEKANLGLSPISQPVSTSCL